MDQHADLQVALKEMGLGTIAYLRVLFFDDVKALCGADAEIAPGEYCFALVDASGEPLAIRGSIGACLLAAQEAGFVVAAVH